LDPKPTFFKTIFKKKNWLTYDLIIVFWFCGSLETTNLQISKVEGDTCKEKSTDSMRKQSLTSLKIIKLSGCTSCLDQQHLFSGSVSSLQTFSQNNNNRNNIIESNVRQKILKTSGRIKAWLNRSVDCFIITIQHYSIVKSACL
jgi:hypothetical protein